MLIKRTKSEPNQVKKKLQSDDKESFKKKTIKSKNNVSCNECKCTSDERREDSNLIINM